jgi:guanylate kinase
MTPASALVAASRGAALPTAPPTTLIPKSGEEDDGDDVNAPAFIETATVHGHTRYGTSVRSVRRLVRAGKVAVMDLDIVGAQNVKAHPSLRALVCFISPPSMEVLEARLRGRGTETEENLRIRLGSATQEMEWNASHGADFFDFRLVNDDIDACYDSFREHVLRHVFPHTAGHVATAASSCEPVASGDLTMPVLPVAQAAAVAPLGAPAPTASELLGLKAAAGQPTPTIIDGFLPMAAGATPSPSPHRCEPPLSSVGASLAPSVAGTSPVATSTRGNSSEEAGTPEPRVVVRAAL